MLNLNSLLTSKRNYRRHLPVVEGRYVDGDPDCAAGSQQRAVPSRIAAKADNWWRTQCAHRRSRSRNI
jgi:hypothetical protein